MGLFGSLFGQQKNPAGYLMNLGQQQQPQNAWEMATQPTQDQMAQAYQSNPSFNQQQQFGHPGGVPVVEGLKPSHPGFFDKGGMGARLGKGILGGIADGIAKWGGAPPGYANAMQAKQEYEQRQQELQQQMQARQQERQQSSADAWDMWQRQQDYQRENPDPTDLQRKVEFAFSLPDGPERQAAIQGIQGYGYSPQVMDAKLAQQQQLINDRAAAQRSVKMTAPGGNGGGGGAQYEYRRGPDGSLQRRRVR